MACYASFLASGKSSALARRLVEVAGDAGNRFGCSAKADVTMCGFCGVVSFEGAPVDPIVLGAMNDAIVHRGPDDGHLFIDGGVGLANRRLSILDLSPGGRLPMTRGAITLAYNGEIYNFAEQRAALEAKGHCFTTTGDTEVVIALYREYGEAFVDYLDALMSVPSANGIFRRNTSSKGITADPSSILDVGQSVITEPESRRIRHPSSVIWMQWAAMH